ncbi:BON domain-containing protein [Ramlibacter ginsenosidimutans]|uniref:BON domain-containing protein n=1 Tax=Ramlibacter ginsenosidimutans TaxID=502333 RepID=A0A934TSF5_9BURK|nr:BON domain-containing protein [Ramlibacter ginsenosidimutans]MBK6006151.1 BON domain-containing protein [Ramlibacter ginsenosidimutans]
MNRAVSFSRLSLLPLAAALLAGALAGCAPLIVGGAAAGAVMMASDRRSSGAQVDDEAIELRAASRLSDAFGDRAHIAIASYNRQVLLTGEVPNDAAKQQAEQIVSRVDNVRGIVNELVVALPSSLTQRSSDTLITGEVRASFVDASDLQANAFRVVTQRGVVYLMGRVTAREAERATSIARQIAGVQRVVRIFEIVTPDELRASGITPPGGAASAPAPASTATPAPVTPPAAAEPPASAGPVVTPVR